MSIVDSSSQTEGQGEGELRLSGSPRALHRLATVRRLQGISRHTLARRMHVEVSDVSRQEDETSDLPLSKLYAWQKALDVPVAELLIESEDTLAQPLLQRAQMIRLMKTALAIFEQSVEDTVRLMAQTLVEQLIEIMPELRGVSAWHTVGKRRRLDELGVAAERSLSEEVFIDLSE
ncbi:MAG: helix-turn-helix transcriptional regulator [Thermoguttaceae bacterium]|jgi:transcriptional regulator with XRE-family HTH domain